MVWLKTLQNTSDLTSIVILQTSCTRTPSRSVTSIFCSFSVHSATLLQENDGLFVPVFLIVASWGREKFNRQNSWRNFVVPNCATQEVKLSHLFLHHLKIYSELEEFFLGSDVEVFDEEGASIVREVGEQVTAKKQHKPHINQLVWTRFNCVQLGFNY